MRYLATILFILLSSLAYSQLVTQNTRSYVGVSVGGQTGSSYIQHSVLGVNMIETYIYGFNAAAHFRYFPDFKKGKLNTGFQVSTKYIEKGWGQEFFTPEISGEVRVTRMNYLMLPLDAIIYAGKPKSRIYIMIGPYLEYLVAAVSAERPATELLEIEDFYTYDPKRDPDWGYGFQGSAGYQKDIGNSSLFIEGYFIYSLSNFISSPRYSSPLPTVSNLFSIGASIGYLFSLK